MTFTRKSVNKSIGLVSAGSCRTIWDRFVLMAHGIENGSTNSWSDEGSLRRSLFEHTGGSYPELITRGDIKLFLPPIGADCHDEVNSASVSDI